MTKRKQRSGASGLSSATVSRGVRRKRPRKAQIWASCRLLLLAYCLDHSECSDSEKQPFLACFSNGLLWLRAPGETQASSARQGLGLSASVAEGSQPSPPAGTSGRGHAGNPSRVLLPLASKCLTAKPSGDLTGQDQRQMIEDGWMDR